MWKNTGKQIKLLKQDIIIILLVTVNLLLNLTHKHIIQVNYLVLLNNLMTFLRRKFMVMKILKLNLIKLKLVKVLVSNIVFFFKKGKFKIQSLIYNILIFYLIIDGLNLTEEDISKYYNLI